MPDNPDNQSKPTYGEVGFTGLNRQGGRITEEWFRKLQGPRGRKLYREMADNEPIAGAFLYGLNMFVLQAPWEVRTPRNLSEDNRAIEIAELFHGILFDDIELPWNDVLTEILTEVVYGWSAMETVLKERRGPDAPFPHTSKFDDGLIGVRKLSPRAQEALDEWDYDEDGRLVGMKQRGEFGRSITIPRDKLLLFRTMSHKDSQEGYSLLRRAVKPYLRKRNLEAIEAIGIERNLAGYPVMRIPGEILAPGATGDLASLRTKYEDMVRDIRVDEQHGLLLPSDTDENGNRIFDLDLLSAESRFTETSPVIQRYSREILQSVLADVVMIGHEQIGSFALASSKTELFIFGVASILDSIKAPFNNHLIPKLMDLNGLPRELTPELHYGDVENMDLAVFADALEKLVGIGYAPEADDKIRRHVRQLFDLPEPSAGSEPAPSDNPEPDDVDDE